MIIVNGLKPLTIITKSSILDVASNPRSASENSNNLRIAFQISQLRICGKPEVFLSSFESNFYVI